MNVMVPIMLIGWVPLTIILFLIVNSRKAVLISVIGGVLFLPMVSYDFPGLPSYSKYTAIALGLIIGSLLTTERWLSTFHWRAYDLPMVIWCIASPLVTAFTNKLGLHYGLSVLFENFMIWGVFYWTGRVYFNNLDSLHDLSKAIVFGGTLYIPLCLYEVRMSPQLSIMTYGVFPHLFSQHVRYGGYRPIVFMQHGLMVSLWMAVATTAAYWQWRSGKIRHIMNMPISIITILLGITTFLCKSANGWIMLTIGCCSYHFTKKSFSTKIFNGLLLVFPFYVLLRITGALSVSSITDFFGRFLDSQRVQSLGVRLLQEDLFVAKTIERINFGWGGFGRGWPKDPINGDLLIPMIDSQWLITFNYHGLFGIFFLGTAMLLGPWVLLRLQKKKYIFDGGYIIPVLISLIVVMYMIDNLVNAMLNPIYIMLSGSLIGFYIDQKNEMDKK